MSKLFQWSLAALLVLSCTAISRADDKEDIKTAGRSFAKAMNSADSVEAHKYVCSDEKSAKFVDTFIDVSIAHRKLNEAAVAKFGDDGRKIAGGGPGPQAKNPLDVDHNFDNVEIELHGETAIIEPKAGAGALNCKKDGGQWKLDLSQYANNPQMTAVLPLLAKITPVMNELSGEIKDGKYTSVQDAQMAYRMKLVSAMGIPGGFPGGVPRTPRPPQQ